MNVEEVPFRARLAASVSPEMVGAVLALAVAVPLALGLAIGARSTPAGGVVGGIGATPTGSAVTASPSVAPSVRPVDLRAARQATELNASIADGAADLDAALTAAAPSSTLQEIIRQLNVLLTSGVEAADSMALEPDTAGLAKELADVYRAARGRSMETLRASLADAATYRRGATDLVEILAALPPINRRLETLVGQAGSP